MPAPKTANSENTEHTRSQKGPNNIPHNMENSTTGLSRPEKKIEISYMIFK